MGYAGWIVGRINRTIERLREEWEEDIPKMNAFVFRTDNTCTSYIVENVFGKDEGEQPSPKEIAAHAAAIAAYDKWDKVIEVLRQEAFNTIGRRNGIKSEICLLYLLMSYSSFIQ